MVDGSLIAKCEDFISRYATANAQWFQAGPGLRSMPDPNEARDLLRDIRDARTPDLLTPDAEIKCSCGRSYGLKAHGSDLRTQAWPTRDSSPDVEALVTVILSRKFGSASIYWNSAIDACVKDIRNHFAESNAE